MDSYVNIIGHHIYGWDELLDSEGLCNIPATAFLRPYNSKLKVLEDLKLRRIKSSMKAAAQQGKIYHLWWHPHNFGSNLEENMNMLRSILKYYKSLSVKYGMESLSMKEVTERVLK